MTSIIPNRHFNNGLPGLQDPNNPFVKAGRPDLYMNFDESGTQLAGIQLLTQPITVPPLANFNDPRWGNASQEQIWAYKSQVLAAQTYLCQLLAQDMANTVHQGINRPGWATQIASALTQIQEAEQATKQMCDTVTESKPVGGS